MGSKSNSIREIPWQMLQEILLKLPTKDVARSCCVSRLWRSVVRDESFRNLHAMASHVTSARAETLLVSRKRVPGLSDEAGVYRVSSGRTMCCVPIPSNYWFANVCNGFLCLEHNDGPEAPALVCNPVTGETLRLPITHPLITSDLYQDILHPLVLGFSSSTREYKLFRLSYPRWSSSPEEQVEMVVYTLGDSDTVGSWRQRPFISRYRPTTNVSTPVFLHDKLYMLTVGWKHTRAHEIPRNILAIDVTSETCCTYNLPDYETRPYEQPLVGVFELNGQLWFAAHLLDRGPDAIRFWSMSPLQDVGEPCSWDLRYSFHMGRFCFARPWGCWLDEDEMLWYMLNDDLHRCDTRKQASISGDGLQLWDEKLQLPAAPWQSKCQWSVRGGYRPTLLSPLTFAFTPSHAGDPSKHKFEHGALSKMRVSKRSI